MNYIPKALWQRWIVIGQILFASIVGMLLFALLNVASAGIFISLLSVGIVFALVGLAHYLFWGRSMTEEVAAPRAAARSAAEAPARTFLLELNDQERRELLQILEQSMPVRAGQFTRDGAKSVRRELFEKLRMFGA